MQFTVENKLETKKEETINRIHFIYGPRCVTTFQCAETEQTDQHIRTHLYERKKKQAHNLKLNEKQKVSRYSDDGHLDKFAHSSFMHMD